MGKQYFRNMVNTASCLVLATFLCGFAPEKGGFIDYLGQKPPGKDAELFAPHLMRSSFNVHSAPTFSSDGSVVVWAIMDSKYRTSLVEMRKVNGSWSSPVMPSFVDSAVDYVYPSFSVDGKTLFFSSRRKMPAGYPTNNGNRIWQVERTRDGWGNPVPFDTTVSRGQGYANSITSDGTIYFSSALGGGANWNIRKAVKVKGRYTEPVLLPYSINGVGYEDGPYIAPDESFLIFESQRPGGASDNTSLYISFQSANGRWSLPVSMGAKINSGKGERFARLSPDGKYLFFGSYRNQSPERRGADMYWIDATVIDELKKDTTTQATIEQPLGNEVIEALYQNDSYRSVGLLQRWLGLYPNSLDAAVIYSANLRKQKRYAEAEQIFRNNMYSWGENSSVIMEKALIKLGMNKDDEAEILLSPMLVAGGQQRDRYKYLANALLEMGKFQASNEYFEKAMRINANMFEYLRRARAFALIGEKDYAFENLNKSLEQGFSSRKELENDADLRSLMLDVRWKALMEKLR